MPKIAIIIPCHNEAAHISTILKALQQLKNSDLTIVVLDDGSSDNTTAVARAKTPFVLRHRINLGKGAALRTGCDFAFEFLGVDYVVLMDADEQHSVADLPLFLAQIEKGTTLMLGVRSFAGMPKMAALLNRLSSWIVWLLSGVYVPDIPSGYKAFDRAIYQQLSWRASGYDVELEMALLIAGKKLPFVVLPISTIYPNYVRGMNVVLDGIKVMFKIFGLK